MPAPRFRLPGASTLEAIQQLRCKIFDTTYNPQQLRQGSKILKKNLRGPAMLEYYGKDRDAFDLTKGNLKRLFGVEMSSPYEATRLASIKRMRDRGKLKPKKKSEEDTLKNKKKK